MITTRAANVVLLSVVSVCNFACLSVNTITPEPLEIGDIITKFLWHQSNPTVKREAKFENG